MNNRIQELLAQAITDVDYIHFDKAIDEELAQMYIPDVFAERFAELIVRECAEIARVYSEEGVEFGGGDAIREHFGVAE